MNADATSGPTTIEDAMNKAMEPLPPLVDLERFARRWADLEHDERLFLTRHGWAYTCQTPGSLWMYQKALPDGRVILTDHDTALQFEEHLSAT